MARSCGIRLGPRRYEIVVLDGGPKRHRITAFKSAEFDRDADDPVHEAIAALKHAAKELAVPRENIGLVIDSGHAAFRRLSLPFSDTTKIDQVIKYEVEGRLPQWNIDDVIVDYHVMDEIGTSSEILVTAVPKDDVQAALDVVNHAGIEPLEAELETSAVVNAACAAEICTIDDAQLLVHIGDHSTSVVIMDGAKVREMRVIHIGALTHDVLSRAAPPDLEKEEKDEAGDADEKGVEVEVPVEPDVDPAEVARRVDQAIKRIRRELGRTISGARTVHPIEAIYVCGMELPGLVGSSVLDVPVYILDCFEEDGGQPADGFGELVVAYGAAYRQLGGGVMHPSLRREELRYAGTWERLEFPLAVASLMLATLLGVVLILQTRKLEYQRDNGFLFWLRSSNLWMVGSGGAEGNMYPLPRKVEEHAALFPEPPGKITTNVEPFDALVRTKALVETELKDLEKELGQDASIEQPQSAFVGAYLVMSVLDQHHEQWRPAIWSIKAETEPGRPPKQVELVRVNLNLVFFSDGDESSEGSSIARKHYENFIAEMNKQPWCLEAPMKGTDTLDSGKGIHIQAQTVSVDVSWFYKKLRADAEARLQ